MAHSILNDDIIDKWQHIAVVSSGGNIWQDGHQMSLYLNGSLVASERSASEPAKKAGDPPQQLYFGGCPDHPIFPEQSVSEFRIWNTVRSSSQMKANMRTTLKGNEAGLWFYLPLQEAPETEEAELVDLASGKRAKLNLDHVVL